MRVPNPEGWVKVVRQGDRETIGYLEPLAADYSLVQPRNVLGHAVGEPVGFLEAEELLLEHGISELAERWYLVDAPAELRGGVSILEVSPGGIVVAHAELTKALVPTGRITVPWPDAGRQLGREAPAEGVGHDA